MVELSQYDLSFEVGRAIKSQALVDFLAENASIPLDTATPSPSWNLYVDGSSTKDGSGAGLIIETSQGERQEHALKFVFMVPNNAAEYEALIAAIDLCYTAGV